MLIADSLKTPLIKAPLRPQAGGQCSALAARWQERPAGSAGNGQNGRNGRNGQPGVNRAGGDRFRDSVCRVVQVKRLLATAARGLTRSSGDSPAWKAEEPADTTLSAVGWNLVLKYLLGHLGETVFFSPYKIIRGQMYTYTKVKYRQMQRSNFPRGFNWCHFQMLLFFFCTEISLYRVITPWECVNAGQCIWLAQVLRDGVQRTALREWGPSSSSYNQTQSLPGRSEVWQGGALPDKFIQITEPEGTLGR